MTAGGGGSLSGLYLKLMYKILFVVSYPKEPR